MNIPPSPRRDDVQRIDNHQRGFSLFADDDAYDPTEFIDDDDDEF